MKTNRIIAIALLATVGTGVTLTVLKSKRQFQNAQHSAAQSVTVPAMVRSLRPTYPYSIIPGGVYSRAELETQLRRDPVARLHYADFRTENTRLVSSPQEHFAYVSYRRQGQVFWTKNKLRISKGELLLTDGQHLARTRCGNRISDQLPANAETSSKEPAAELTMPTASGPTVDDQRITFSAPPPSTMKMAALSPLAELPWQPKELPFQWVSSTQNLSASPTNPSLASILAVPFILPAAGQPAAAASTFGATSGIATAALLGSRTSSTGGIVGTTVIPAVPVAPVPEPCYGLLLGFSLTLLFGNFWLRMKRQR